MPDILRTGISGLLAAQRAIATTSHNITNVDTDGYSRQRVNYVTRPAQETTGGYVGQGVSVSGIERINNQFLQTRLEGATSSESRVGTFYEMMSRIDVILAEDNSGLASLQTDFFNALQDLNTNPTSVGARQSVLNGAANLADRFNGLQGQFDALQSETNNRIGTVIKDINTIAENIANLNLQIVQSGSNPPNDLLDQRDQQLTELSELVSIRTLAMDDGSVGVIVGNGLNLVSGPDAMQLAETPDPEQPEKTRIMVRSSNGDRVIQEQVSGGALGGLLDFRHELDNAMNHLGRLSIILADQFNDQHRQGLTLEGDPGGDFFVVPEPDVSNADSNTGSATVTAAFTDTTALSTSDYRLDYNGVDYTLTRLSDNASVTGAGPLAMDGLEINVSGTANSGDSFLIRPTRKAAREFSFALNNVEEIALSGVVRSEAPVDNLGTGEITPPSIIDFDNPALANSVEIRFNNPPDTFDVIDTTSGTTVDSGVPYEKGEPIEYQGWRVSISGEPEDGDTFLIEFNGNGTGNNRNGQALADLQNALLVEGSSNLLDGYGAFVSLVGSNTRQAQINSDAMEAMLEEARVARENVSGVNLDEEAINLTRHQQSFQASAQVIAAADNLFQVLIGAIGR